jgi:hypothetical protein
MARFFATTTVLCFLMPRGIFGGLSHRKSRVVTGPHRFCECQI